MTIKGEETCEELQEALGHLNHRAKRRVPCVGTRERPTDWDKAHDRINTMLTELERKGALA